jgi:hypothetical protein
MGYTLKVLERTTNATVAAAVNVPNLFASESTGYVGTGGTAAFDAANHRWTLTGAASRVDMNWSYVTTTPATTGKIVFYRATVKVNTAGMTNVRLLLAGTTSGFQIVKVQNAPAANTEYDLYVRVALSGLVGNLKLLIDVNDDVSVTGVVLTVTNWVVLDLTANQGTGYESSEANVKSYLDFRSKGWTWQDWYGADPYYKLIRIAVSHGLETYSMVAWDSNPGVTYPEYFSQVYSVDSQWISVRADLGATAASSIWRWNPVDRTSRLLANSLRITLRYDAEATFSFHTLSDATWEPKCGMTVLLYSGTELVQSGKVSDLALTSLVPNAKWRTDVTIEGFSHLPERQWYLGGNNLDFLTTKQAIKAVWDTQLCYRNGVLWGRVDDGATDTGEIDSDLANGYELVSSLAKQGGLSWYIDHERRLHVRSAIATAAAAAHALIDGNGYTGYRDVRYTKSIDKYATNVLAKGGYQDDGTPLREYGAGGGSGASIDVEACAPYYMRIINDSTMWNPTDAEQVIWAYMDKYSTDWPGTLEFVSTDIDWRPNTSLQVKLATIGIPATRYFNIDSVDIEDLDGVNLQARVTCSSGAVSVPLTGTTEYVADVQVKAQGSVGALKQEAGSFTPELVGSTNPGTWSYTVNTGYFVRIGNMVFVAMRITIGSVSGSPTGSVKIQGLPYNSSGAADFTQYLDYCGHGTNWGTSKTFAKLLLTGGTSTALMYGFQNDFASGWAAVPIGNVAAGDEMRITGWYQIVT